MLRRLLMAACVFACCVCVTFVIATDVFECMFVCGCCWGETKACARGRESVYVREMFAPCRSTGLWPLKWCVIAL